MKTLIFAPPSSIHELLEGDERVPAGGEFTVTNDRADQLLADSTVPVHEPVSGLGRLKRDELNTLAEQAGITDPAELPNRDAVIAAIESTQPAADDGEGQPINEEA